MTAREPIWDGPTRWFHWINAGTIGLLVGSGLFFLFRESFHVDGREAKMALKTAHVWAGNVFAVNFLLRIIWGFRGNANARWAAVLPDRRALRAVPTELRALRARTPIAHAARSPVSRLSATAMFAVMLVLSGTGLIRSGTDLYFPPFGGIVASYVAGPGGDGSAISWQTEEERGNPYRLWRIGQVKTPVGLAHKYGSFVMIGLVVLHISGVVLTEVRQQSGIVSAMVSGRIKPPSGGSPDGEANG